MDSWEKIDSIMRKGEQSVASSDLPERPLASLEEATTRFTRERLDFIGRFKAGAIDRRAALQQIRAVHEAQLEAVEHALKRAVDVERERVDIIAKKYIFEITEEYLRDMQSMGIHNYKARMETLLKLNEQAAQLLRQAEAQDVPPRMREKTIESICKKYDEFVDRLTADEIRLR